MKNNTTQLQKIILLVVFLVVAGLFFHMFAPYLFSLFWAAVFASLFYPLHTKIVAKTANHDLSAFVTIVVVLLLVILPLGVISAIMVNEVTTLYTTLNNEETINIIKDIVDRTTEFPAIQEFIGDFEIEEELKNISGVAATVIFGWIRSWTQNIALLAINVFVMLYALYYFLRDGKKLLLYLMRIVPLGDDTEKILFNKFTSTSRATLKGTILLGVIQGVLGGITIFIVGIPSVFFLTLIMIILSIIPAVGPLFVLLPAIIYMVFFGSVWQIVVLAIGLVIVSLADNFLRPMLVGSDLDMHPLIIFLSTVGGLGIFGISGVVVGPIIAALLLATLDTYEQHYSQSDLT